MAAKGGHTGGIWVGRAEMGKVGQTAHSCRLSLQRAEPKLQSLEARSEQRPSRLGHSSFL